MARSKNFEWMQKGTFEMLDLWLFNYARNLPDILNGESIRKLGKFKSSVNSKVKFSPEDSAIVIGAGPSVIENHHLELIKSNNFEGTIVCTDRMLIPCLKAGITPDNFPRFYVISIDPIQRISKYYDDPIVKKFSKKIHVSLSTCSSPKVVSICKKFKIKIHWFHPLIDDYRQTDISKTPHYNEFIKISDGEHKKAKKYCKKIKNPHLKSTVLIDSIFDYYREALCNLVTLTPKWVNTVNATEG